MKKPKKPKTTAQLRKLAWNAFSKWYRKSQADALGRVWCYTCGTWSHWKQIQSGHAIPGRHAAVLFDEEIIRPQCPRCNGNWGLRGNYQVFVPKLIREHGNDGLEWWDEKLY